MTGQGLVDLILKDLGEVEGDEGATASESADALATLNHIIASWSNKGLIVATRTHGSFSLTADTPTYAMGTGQTFNTTSRVMKIEGAEAVSGKFRNGLECLPYDQFRLKVENATGLTAVLPEILGFDNGASIVTVSLFPTPNTTSVNLLLDYWLALTAIATLGTTLAFPEGFEWALRTAGVMALAPSYGQVATATMQQNAKEALANLAEINASLRAMPAAAAE
jgi:hypothetical protein